MSGWNGRDKPRVLPCSRAWMREGTSQRGAPGKEEQVREVNEFITEVLLQHPDGCDGTAASGTPSLYPSSVVIRFQEF